MVLFPGVERKGDLFDLEDLLLEVALPLEVTERLPDVLKAALPLGMLSAFWMILLVLVGVWWKFYYSAQAELGPPRGVNLIVNGLPLSYGGAAK
jgi:quinol-cytochrome oxidoreductase complex cytochrome b subunit